MTVDGSSDLAIQYTREPLAAGTNKHQKNVNAVDSFEYDKKAFFLYTILPKGPAFLMPTRGQSYKTFRHLNKGLTLLT